jgi:hypothetical protein
MQNVAMPPIPAAPVPHPRRLTLLRAVRALRSNPITVFAEAAFEEQTLELDRPGKTLLVNDPSLIERVLIGNATNYCKSVQQQRRLEPALGNGLLTAKGEDWRSTRRITSPLFSPRAVEGLRVPPGFGRGLDCLMRNADALSAPCRGALEGGEMFNPQQEPPNQSGKIQP